MLDIQSLKWIIELIISINICQVWGYCYQISILGSLKLEPEGAAILECELLGVSLGQLPKICL